MACNDNYYNLRCNRDSGEDSLLLWALQSFKIVETLKEKNNRAEGGAQW